MPGACNMMRINPSQIENTAMKILQSSKCSRVNVVLAVIVVIAACSLPLMVVADANAGPPNVVIIMTDDMGLTSSLILDPKFMRESTRP